MSVAVAVLRGGDDDCDDDLDAWEESNQWIRLQNDVLQNFVLANVEEEGDEDVELSIEDKNDIVTEQIERAQQEMKECAIRGEGKLREIRNALRELEQEVADIKRDTHAFNRNVVHAPMHEHTSQHQRNQALLKFFSDRVVSLKNEKEKFELKVANQKNLIKKLRMLVAEMESGEAVHVVDFEQMKIENCQLLEQIQEKNQALMNAKVAASKAIQKLNATKEALAEREQQMKVLKSQAATREVEEAVCESSQRELEQQEIHLQQRFRQALARSRDLEKPDILSYVKLKSEVEDLERKVAEWKRKVEIAERSKPSKMEP